MIRRRRVCEACGERFSTVETFELKLPAVIKSDSRREPFSAHKLRLSFDRALQKRPVSEEQVEAAVRHVISRVRQTGERELPSRMIGEFVMTELRKIDQVGYVRFASVYRSFEDVADFREELDRLERDHRVLADSQLSLLSDDAEPKSGRKGK